MDILSQIVETYLSDEFIDNKKLSKEEAGRYFRRVRNIKNLVWLEDNGELQAWMEYWVVNQEQMERLVKDTQDKFTPFSEETTEGDIYYVVDLFILQSYRSKSKRLIYSLWRKAEEVTGKKKVITLQERKNNKRFRVFKGGG